MLWDNARRKGCPACAKKRKGNHIQVQAIGGVEPAEPFENSTTKMLWKCSRDATHPTFIAKRKDLGEYLKRGVPVCMACALHHNDRTYQVTSGDYRGGDFSRKISMNWTCRRCGGAWRASLLKTMGHAHC